MKSGSSGKPLPRSKRVALGDSVPSRPSDRIPDERYDARVARRKDARDNQPNGKSSVPISRERKRGATRLTRSMVTPSRRVQMGSTVPVNPFSKEDHTPENVSECAHSVREHSKPAALTFGPTPAKSYLTQSRVGGRFGKKQSKTTLGSSRSSRCHPYDFFMKSPDHTVSSKISFVEDKVRLARSHNYDWCK
eukprot:CAMPEP_0197538720 /NCGR_PEP_ID=MMETSP1318-20131121/60437_1 /TAXON_ID=552666 /ORGANISM="Partenskyella glossopodia, Strain RCC365" /LENGTH=191 /DNA_ID=CAMNT_0043097211 /DNA_START=114 /DNA_END=686 /DNA_ORIENTATION=+